MCCTLIKILTKWHWILKTSYSYDINAWWSLLFLKHQNSDIPGSWFKKCKIQGSLMTKKVFIGFIALCQIKALKSLSLCMKSTHVCCAFDRYFYWCLSCLVNTVGLCKRSLAAKLGSQWEVCLDIMKTDWTDWGKNVACPPKDNQHQGLKHLINPRGGSEFRCVLPSCF